MNQEQIAAAVLASSFKDKIVKEAKGALAEGDEIRGDLTVHIPFRLTKGFGSEIKPTATVLSQAVLAKALVYAGVTADAFKNALLQAAKEALDKGHKLSQEVALDPRVAVMSAEIDDVINQMPKTPRAGSVGVKVLTESGLPEVTSLTFAVTESLKVEKAA